MNDAHHPGVLDDHDGGLTLLGRTVMDAWVFGLIPETQTCSERTPAQMQELADRVSQAWPPTDTCRAVCLRGCASAMPRATTQR